MVSGITQICNAFVVVRLILPIAPPKHATRDATRHTYLIIRLCIYSCIMLHQLRYRDCMRFIRLAILASVVSWFIRLSPRCDTAYIHHRIQTAFKAGHQDKLFFSWTEPPFRISYTSFASSIKTRLENHRISLNQIVAYLVDWKKIQPIKNYILHEDYIWTIIVINYITKAYRRNILRIKKIKRIWIKNIKIKHTAVYSFFICMYIYVFLFVYVSIARRLIVRAARGFR